MKIYKTALPELTLKYKTGEQKKVKIKQAKDAYEVFKTLFDADTIEYSECMIVLHLNRAGNTIGWIKTSMGGIGGTVMDRKTIFSSALVSGASAIIIAHNHPSGNLKPSAMDIKTTKSVIEAGKVIDISVFDHLIMTKDGFTSMQEEGLI